MKRIILLTALFPLLGAAGWWAYANSLENSLPPVEIQELTSLAGGNERTLPFYELMSPLPTVGDDLQVIPKLEYKKGPPERYLERMTVLFQAKGEKERIIYHGRKTESYPWPLRFFPEGPNREALYLEAALRLSQGQNPPGLNSLQLFLAKPFLLQSARTWLSGATTVYLMRQADCPAFLVEYKQELSNPARFTALFLRRNSLYRVDYMAERGFSVLSPKSLFQKSFLVEKRSDALEYLARNLSEVQLRNQEVQSFGLREITWPILLLAANVSVDPASIEGFFHLAGISALLLRSKALDNSNEELVDALRNNVLASEFYAKDIDPNSPKTAQIARLAALLTRNFDQ